jgi:GxxExxY protein
MGKTVATLIYPHESYYLCGLFYEVQNKLGNALKEKQYADALELKFKKNKDAYKREVSVPIDFEDGKIEGNKMDFIFEKIILIDAKAKKYITREDYREMLRYLKATGLKLGLIANFRPQKVMIKRIINNSINHTN